MSLNCFTEGELQIKERHNLLLLSLKSETFFSMYVYLILVVYYLKLVVIVQLHTLQMYCIIVNV